MPRTDDTLVRDPHPRSGFLRRLAARVAVPAAAVLGLSLVGTPAAADEVEEVAFQQYVALGDSFTAGPLVTGEVRPRMPLLGCLQSSANYPKFLAEELGVGELIDVSCSGAVISHFYEAQFSYQPPQLDALTEDTDLVTVGIAGNDFGFADILLDCATRSFTNPFGSPCADHHGDGLDERIEELRGEVSAVYADIAERSPNATVLSVGYLQILPERGGCWPSVPISRGDVPFLDEAQISLNEMLREESTAQGAVFVDVMERGHDACKPADTRWVEGVIPENEAAPVHPNRAGMEATADFISDVIGVPAL